MLHRGGSELVCFKISLADADVLGMTDGDRKSSDDLIRDANRRLRASQVEETAPLTTPPTSEPAQDGPSEAEPLRYRSTPSSDGDEPPPTSPSSRRSTAGSAIVVNLVRWGLAFLVFGGWFLFTRFDDASRDDSGQIVSAGDLDVMAMQVGDCFDDHDDDADVVVDVSAAPCSEPHDNEVFAVLSLAGGFPGEEYPGAEPLWDHSYEVCSGSVFDAYVGTPYLDSTLEVFSFTPSQESWDDGDREFVCALFRLDFGQLTGTARDSGL